ncbi:hypothetical protein JW930_06080 [Candidatus Woesearchaeota archaeon]|nr:hypothetical protein [Candidatus Woesearchaeota archaeon]
MQVLKNELNFLKKEYNLSFSQICELVEQDRDILVPVQIFSFDLSPLESLVKFLKENRDFNYHKIGILLNRDERTIWITYKNAIKKQKDKFIVKKIKYLVPVEKLQNRKYSVLESLCSYLIMKENLSINDISILLNKNPSSIWTVYKRYLKKKQR